jgi:lipopolysaccharide transport system ATP-binding protein
MSDTVLKAEDISKLYKIGVKRKQSLREIFSGLSSGLWGNNLPEENIKDFWALKDISFEIKQGDAVGIIGKNGAGKSTLLKILSRITKPSSGKIEINGRVAALLEVGTGFHPELSGRENIYLNGAILGMTRKEIKSKFDEIVYFSGVEKFLETPVKRFSSGMYVRLAFSIAAHLEPDILIIDEVLAVGDAEFQKKCLGKMKDVNSKEGRTVLFVSHDVQAISTLTKKCIYLKSGKIDFYGETNLAINNYHISNLKKDEIYINSTSNKKPQITSVELLTSLNNNIHLNGEMLTVKIKVNFPYKVKSPWLAIHFKDYKERNYVHVWTNIDSLINNDIIGPVELVCHIPKLRLYMGKYSCELFLSEPPGGELFEHLENICPFEIVMYNKNRDFPWNPNACSYIEENHWEVTK